MSDSTNISAILKVAEQTCAERGERLTPLRARVLELVASAQGPIKAYDLLDQLKVGPGAAKPPTVYRALDFLLNAGLVHKVEALKAFVACAHDHEDGRGAELYICESCGHVDEAGCATAEPKPPQGFAVQRSVIEHYGQCGDCVNEA